MIAFLFVLHILIYVTDILDGKLARHLHASSKLGELLDVIADLGYMTSQYFLFIKADYMPVMILVCIYLEFVIFVKTSMYYKPMTNRNFFFNKLGKIIAAYYYVIPLLYTGTIILQGNNLIFAGINATCTILTGIAIFDRLLLCTNVIPHTTNDKNKIFYS